MSTPADQDQPTRRVQVSRVRVGGQRKTEDDVVATEEPLEIRIVTGPRGNRRSKSLAITMRTPGHDHELAMGFLCSEGLIERPADVLSWEFAGPPPEVTQTSGQTQAHGNTLMVELAVHVEFRPEELQRNFYLTSSCGICGKASLAAVRAQGFAAIDDRLQVSEQIVLGLANRLRESQSVFESTGGIHAAGLFDAAGTLIVLREDVGRHNAVDKLIGASMLNDRDRFPEPDRILVVSGRASFELVQKAISASLGMLVAVGAPSSLAVELAEEMGVTLIGFASDKRFNIYTHGQRVV